MRRNTYKNVSAHIITRKNSRTKKWLLLLKLIFIKLKKKVLAYFVKMVLPHNILADKCKIIKKFIHHPLGSFCFCISVAFLSSPFIVISKFTRSCSEFGPNQLRSFRWEYPKLCKQMPFFKKSLQLQLHSLILKIHILL